MADHQVRTGEIRRLRSAEAARIALLLQRDGLTTTSTWVRRTLAIYGRAVLDRRHFAHTAEYRLRFIASCLEFRCWLAANGGYGNRATFLRDRDDGWHSRYSFGPRGED
jgi:hypothetical protein